MITNRTSRDYAEALLTSHEVIIESIAATTTRTGLHATARLDTSTHPTGAAVRGAETAALPLTRRAFHGDWNYALHPRPASVIPAARTTRTHNPEWELALLSDPLLTGMSRRQLDNLVQNLAPHGDSRRGRPPRLALPDQVLATVLHLRVNLAAEPLAVLFGSSRTETHRTFLKTRRLLETPDIVIARATTPPAALATLQTRVTNQSREPNSEIETTC